ncbi:ABC transporter substrate-binding protein [Desmospora activa]|uniref:Multiple sugar transport system substrate-binding protein n=1 Tax=Desmospora activa DSM 45169 TaxID=1121389 RepID=A0A2T4Z7H3_9BACL|nr:ABC transporter substrate-binding protein [Desmospora activa]PTM57840.1 multiple sugar transport system substrate-binding protein [Desmospora activa DSM 45169]
MQKMKWSKGWILLLVAVIALLPACSGGKQVADGGELTLTFWNGFTGPDGEDMKRIIDQFNQEHKGEIQIKAQTMPWGEYYDKIRTVVSSGQAPDVAIMHVDQLPKQADLGVIMPIDEYIQDFELKEEDFLPAVWEAGMYKDQRYAIPLDVHPIGLYYNVDLLKEAGFEKPPATMEEFLEVAEATTIDGNRDGKIDQWGFPMPIKWPSGMIYFSTLYQMGGEAVSKDGLKALYNSPEGVKAAQLLESFISEHQVSPKNIQQDGEVTLFRQGKAAMHINGIWMINAFKEQKGLNFDVAPMPTFGEKSATWAGSHNFVLPRQKKTDPKRIEAAMTFIEYVTDHSIEWAHAGQIPAKNSVRESEEFQDIKFQSHFADVDTLVFPYPSPTYVDVWVPAEEALNEILLGKKEAKTALKQAADKGEKKAEAAAR